MNPFIDRGPVMRMVGSIFGANKIYHGVDDQIALQIQEGALKEQMLEEEQAMQLFGVNGTQKVSDIMYSSGVQRYLSQLMSIREGMVYGSLRAAAANRPDIKLEIHQDKIDAILNMGDRLYSLDQFKNQAPGTSLKEKVINKEYLESNIEKFKRLLTEKFDKVTPEMAERIANESRDISFVEDIASAVDARQNIFHSFLHSYICICFLNRINSTSNIFYKRNITDFIGNSFCHLRSYFIKLFSKQSFKFFNITF
jgi:hypothetical protein